MPKAIVLQTYDNNLRKDKNHISYFKHYDLGSGVKVKLHKEREAFTRDAGWGVKALTDIKKGFVLGSFAVKKRDADKPEEGTYSIKTPTGKFIVMHPHSLLNKINTIVQKEYRHKCNCRIGNVSKNGRVSIRTTRKIKRNEMLWVKYGESYHYWKIQYSILEKRLRKVQSNAENEDHCKRCNKRGTLLLCDSCPSALCEGCLTIREKFLIERKHFFCNECLEKPPKYMNRFKRKTT